MAESIRKGYNWQDRMRSNSFSSWEAEIAFAQSKGYRLLGPNEDGTRYTVVYCVHLDGSQMIQSGHRDPAKTDYPIFVKEEKSQRAEKRVVITTTTKSRVGLLQARHLKLI